VTKYAYAHVVGSRQSGVLTTDFISAYVNPMLTVGTNVHRSEAETLNMPHHGSVSETPVFRATQSRDDNLEGMDWMGV
jgi:hypothetical protein